MEYFLKEFALIYLYIKILNLIGLLGRVRHFNLLFKNYYHYLFFHSLKALMRVYFLKFHHFNLSLSFVRLLR